eukprot:TRINITY_DN18579_c1_g1_i1.p2 TRINITY_DN18579_c1_g1~~TRINITY_DN18579_c1_g1_i1.p2  ORF type:complete len:350 (+),score=22.97 TRINITY_DN18579_c1_g1_i1:66-1115(+)
MRGSSRFASEEQSSSIHKSFHNKLRAHVTRSHYLVTVCKQQTRTSFARPMVWTSKPQTVLEREKLTLPDGRQGVFPGKVSKPLKIPEGIAVPEWYETGIEPKEWAGMETLDEEGQECMRKCGELVRKVFDLLQDKIEVGVTTDELDRCAHEFIVQNKAYPSLFNCNGFPKSISTSVNEVICAGVPDDRKLENGDIVNIYVAVYLDGYHTCASRVFYVGEVQKDVKRLCEAAETVTMNAIKCCEQAQYYQEIGKVVDETVSKSGFVLQDVPGHGIGTRFHCEPLIPHSLNQHKGLILPFQAFTVGPVLTEEKSAVKLWEDGWTFMTKNRCLAAQYMHTVLVTKDSCEILT